VTNFEHQWYSWLGFCIANIIQLHFFLKEHKEFTMNSYHCWCLLVILIWFGLGYGMLSSTIDFFYTYFDVFFQNKTNENIQGMLPSFLFWLLLYLVQNKIPIGCFYLIIIPTWLSWKLLGYADGFQIAHSDIYLVIVCSNPLSFNGLCFDGFKWIWI
jgi:hypothetical protein